VYNGQGQSPGLLHHTRIGANPPPSWFLWKNPSARGFRKPSADSPLVETAPLFAEVTAKDMKLCDTKPMNSL